MGWDDGMGMDITGKNRTDPVYSENVHSNIMKSLVHASPYFQSI